MPSSTRESKRSKYFFFQKDALPMLYHFSASLFVSVEKILESLGGIFTQLLAHFFVRFALYRIFLCFHRNFSFLRTVIFLLFYYFINICHVDYFYISYAAETLFYISNVFFMPVKRTWMVVEYQTTSHRLTAAKFV